MSSATSCKRESTNIWKMWNQVLITLHRSDLLEITIFFKSFTSRKKVAQKMRWKIYIEITLISSTRIRSSLLIRSRSPPLTKCGQGLKSMFSLMYLTVKLCSSTAESKIATLLLRSQMILSWKYTISILKSKK